MLIAVDARALRRPMAGIGRYQYFLGEALSRAMPEARFVAVGCAPLELDLPGGWKQAWDAPGPWRRLPRLAWLRWRAGRFARELGAQVFWGGSLQIPRPVAGLRTLLTTYDLVHRLAPETLGWKGRIALTAFLADDVRRADAVVAISAGTDDRIAGWCGRRADAIVRPAVDPSFAPPNADRLLAWRAARALTGPYVLALGTREPRKNLELLARAWALAQDRLGGLRLVLAGRSGWRHAGTDAVLAALGDRVVDLGYLPPDELPLALAGSEVLAFPSRYEGFGMPVAEALAVGTPVIAAAMPEIEEASQGRHHRVELTEASLAAALVLAAHGGLTRPDPQPPAWTWDSGAATLAPILRGLARG